MGSQGGSKSGNTKSGMGKKLYLTQEEENAALVVGGLKALDTVLWQMLASVMIPGVFVTASLSTLSCAEGVTASVGTLIVQRGSAEQIPTNVFSGLHPTPIPGLNYAMITAQVNYVYIT